MYVLKLYILFNNNNNNNNKHWVVLPSGEYLFSTKGEQCSSDRNTNILQWYHFLTILETTKLHI